MCTIGADGLCDGCLRTLAEIARWGAMSQAERNAVYAVLAEREGRRRQEISKISNGMEGPRAREQER